MSVQIGRILMLCLGGALLSGMVACGGGSSSHSSSSGLTSAQYLEQGVDYLYVSGSLQYDHNHVQLVGSQNAFVNSDPYVYSSGAFAEQSPSRSTTWANRIIISQASQAWATVTGPWVYTSNSNGTVSFNNGWDGSGNTLSYSSVSIAGKPIASYVSASMISGINLAVKSGAVFGTGAKFITANFTQETDGYVLEASTSTTPASLTDVVTSTTTVLSINGGMLQFLTSNTANTSGTAIFTPSGGSAQSITWTRSTVKGVDLVTLSQPLSSGSNEYYLLSMYDGALWWGIHSVAPLTWGNPGKDLVFNDIAMNNLAANLVATTPTVTTLPTSTTSVPAGNIRVHWQYSGSYTENGGWGVYSWAGPLTVNTAYPGGRILFTHVDSYGALVDIPVDPTQSAMDFVILNGTGDASKDANCALNMSATIPSTIATQGEEVWLTYGSCTVSYTDPA